MDKYVCLIFVKHEGMERSFLFAVDPMIDIKQGTKLMVDTCKGQKKAVAICDSFVVNERAMQNIVLATGAYLPLRQVVGIVKRVTEERVVPLSGSFQGGQL